MTDKKISFCIPAYNCEDTIGRCIESILGLTYSNKEIIIVEDGSTDRTNEIIKELVKKYGDITYIHNDGRLGRGQARQKALENATGEYIALLDGDGFITDKNWVEKMLSNFTDEKIAAVFSLSKAI